MCPSITSRLPPQHLTLLHAHSTGGTRVQKGCECTPHSCRPTRVGDRRESAAGGGLAPKISNATLKMTCACFTIFIHTFSPGNTWLREQRQASHDCHLSVWKDAETPEKRPQTEPSPPLGSCGNKGVLVE